PCRLTGLIGRFPVGRHVNELGRAQVVVELVVVAVEHDDLVGGGTIIMTDGTDHGFHRPDPRRHEVLPRPPYDGHSYQMQDPAPEATAFVTFARWRQRLPTEVKRRHHGRDGGTH